MNYNLFFLVVLPVAALAVSCREKVNGHIDIGCKTYVQCTAGVGTTVHCPQGQVYDRKISQCNLMSLVEGACGRRKDCSNVPDGRYADLDDRCRTFYTCFRGNFLLYNYCPDGLVFNQKTTRCEWPFQVPKPCGDLEELL